MPTHGTSTTTAAISGTPTPSLTETTAIPSVEDQGIKTSPANQDSGINGIDDFDNCIEEAGTDVEGKKNVADGDEEYNNGAEFKPIIPKNNGDKRKFGGSTKGRQCYRWSSKQEDAAIKGMLEIRAEGEILGDACFVELHKRLVAKYGAKWNHSVSGIHNAWHRRELVSRVYRAEARARKQKEREEDKEDAELGLVKAKRGRKRKAFTKDTQTKPERGMNIDMDEDFDEEKPVTSSKRVRRNLLPASLAPRPHLTIDTSPTSQRRGSFSSSCLPIPTMSLPDYPTVTISLKPHNNNSRRTRAFETVSTMHKFWNQVVAAACFDNLKTAFMVVSVTINDYKPFNMAQHDTLDYSTCLERLERAVDRAGEGEVVVDVKAVI